VTTENSSTPQQEAVELAPRRECDPVPDVLVYRTGAKPVMEVFVGGQWRTGIVRERLRFEAGRTAYTVTLDPGTGQYTAKTYRWPTGLRVRFVPPAAAAL
jgi:hypothetical protein